MRHAIRRSAHFLCFALSLAILSHVAKAQTFTVLHQFTGGTDGAVPANGITIDAQGNLYGATQAGGDRGYGGVFKLAPHGSGWVFSSLYDFAYFDNGTTPVAGVTIAPDGTLYGTTEGGGNTGCSDPEFGCGTVFRLQPPPTFCQSVLCTWSETVLYYFMPTGTGYNPAMGVIFDRSGNLYGGGEGEHQWKLHGYQLRSDLSACAL